MLHDRARIHVQAGAGGDGAASFRREAHVPRGGPDGGDGGRGGDVVFICDESLRDLQNLTRRERYRAERGGKGEGALRHGADGQTLVLKVPPGTQIEGQEGDLAGQRWELLREAQRVAVAHGGTGGHGNKRFTTATRQAPRFAERGLPGEGGWLALRLKLLADVGLVGLPNAGKSSLLTRLTRAAPKVASYPFTTLEPVLGVLEGDERQLVLADIPGLIEGASAGAGLGHEFLAHIERTRLLVHVLDIAPQFSGEQDADALVNHATIERELAAHDPRLAALPRVLALAKADLLAPEQVREAVRDWSERLGSAVPVIATSAATGQGLDALAGELLHRVPALEPPGPPRVPAAAAEGEALAVSVSPRVPAAAAEGEALAVSVSPRVPAAAAEGELAEHMVFRPAAREGIAVEQVGAGVYAVRGRPVERLLQRFDVNNEDAMAYVEGRLRRLGVIHALEAKGFQPGDELRIGEVVLELDPTA